ncbi:MAG TPA: FtsX-like permease family protein [Candidatus Angelobacter sp.]|nr:FtsX-like permease family protein [Candidatus Angelobacter sp.]
MNRKQLFARLLVKAAWVRKDRALTALISVAVVATIATAALTVYYDLENKLSHEFQSFGANVVVTARNGSLNEPAIETIRSTLAGKGDVVPVAYAIADGPSNTRVVIGGTNLHSLSEMNSWWSTRKMDTAGNALVGSRTAQLYSSGGSGFEIAFGTKKIQVRPQAIFTSGSNDDSRIYLDPADFASLTGVEANTVLVRIDGTPRVIQSKVDQLTAALPQAEVKPVREITHAQTAIVGQTRSVVLTASAIVVVMIMLCMVATFTSSVLERRKDFAVMKALGASNRTVNMLFAAEASLLALAGAAAGYIVGSGIAFWIGKANFDAAILPQPVLLLPVLLGSVVLALIASTAPLRLLQQIQPAGILRGE